MHSIKTTALLLAFAVTLGITGCDESETPHPLLEGKFWVIRIVESEFVGNSGFPRSAVITVEVREGTNGGGIVIPVEDGTLVKFETTSGAFSRGGSIEFVATSDGFASVTLTVDEPGSLSVSVAVNGVAVTVTYTLT